ncbi:hypothetical protein QFZ77_003021 [Paenibacillus sp. V4I3]|uniref:hypothetical protein n=1 Tax=unclassified Paenibacillus TaxID=185978 RepID=UPI002786C283|nr:MULTISPECIES: hypothetical protein [unclassified Paenibacillus]MDQ0874362.1 hypothetical protein [Paenibacillus sp. V4I3]MDQ0897430.1 hypothetical protein [Paenibacillus sp. V4I7]
MTFGIVYEIRHAQRPKVMLFLRPIHDVQQIWQSAILGKIKGQERRRTRQRISDETQEEIGEWA